MMVYVLKKWPLWLVVGMFFLFLQCQHKQFPPNDLVKQGLKGSVKSVSTMLFTEAGKYIDTIVYNPSGYMISQVSYNPDGSLIRRLVSQYMDTLKTSQACYVANDSLAYVLAYIYQDKGLLDTCYIIDNGNSPKLRSAFVYTPQDLLLSEAHYRPDGSLESRMEHYYNSEELREMTQVDDRFSNSKYVVFRKFGLNRKVVEEKIMGEDNRILKIKKTFHDTHLRPHLIMAFSDKMAVTDSISLTYDQNGNVTSLVHSRFQSKPDTTAYVQKVDAVGNWIFKSKIENGVEKEFWIRDVRYF